MCSSDLTRIVQIFLFPSHDMAGAGLDMVGKMLANKGSEVNNGKAEQEIQNLKAINEQITENIGKIKEEKKTVEFENWLNKLKKEATMLYNDGSTISFESLYRANEWSKLKTGLEELNFREIKATFDQSKLEGLFDNLDKIIKGETDGYQTEHQYRDWETDRKSTRLNSSHITRARMPSSA